MTGAVDPGHITPCAEETHLTEPQTATGRCPVCGCAMTRTWTSGQPLLSKGGYLGRRKKPGPKPYHTPCQCETLHVGRPAAERLGCGALLVIAPPQSPANGPTP